MFDPHTNSWRPLNDRLAVGRASLCAELALGDRVLAFGGFEPSEPPFVASRRVEGLALSRR